MDKQKLFKWIGGVMATLTVGLIAFLFSNTSFFLQESHTHPDTNNTVAQLKIQVDKNIEEDKEKHKQVDLILQKLTDIEEKVDGIKSNDIHELKENQKKLELMFQDMVKEIMRFMQSH